MAANNQQQVDNLVNYIVMGFEVSLGLVSSLIGGYQIYLMHKNFKHISECQKYKNYLYSSKS